MRCQSGRDHERQGCCKWGPSKRADQLLSSFVWPQAGRGAPAAPLNCWLPLPFSPGCGICPQTHPPTTHPLPPLPAHLGLAAGQQQCSGRSFTRHSTPLRAWPPHAGPGPLPGPPPLASWSTLGQPPAIPPAASSWQQRRLPQVSCWRGAAPSPGLPTVPARGATAPCARCRGRSYCRLPARHCSGLRSAA